VHTDVAVVGAGISGLAAAHFLRQGGVRATVLEREDRAGGSIRTVHQNGFLFEPGPNSVLDNSEAMRTLIDQVGLGESVEFASEAAANRYIVRHGRLMALPSSPPALLGSRLFSARAKLRLLCEPFIRPAPPTAEETLAEFVLRRLGREFLDRAIDPFVAGTYAGVPEELCVRSAFGKLYALEQEHGSLIRGAFRLMRRRRRERPQGESGRLQTGPSQRLFSFPGGFGALVRALTDELGDDLQTGRRVREIGREGNAYTLNCSSADGELLIKAKSVAVTIDAWAYPDLAFDFDFPLRPALAQIPHPPVTTVFFGYHHDPLGRPLDGFGFLTPRLEQRRILGTLWNSCLFADRAPEGGMALTTFVGGRRQPDNAAWPDDRLVEVVREELRDLMGLEPPPDEAIVHRWPHAIPQYRIGHRDFVRQIEAYEEAHPGLHLAGNYRGGISLGDCVTQAQSLSSRIASELETQRP